MSDDYLFRIDLEEGKTLDSQKALENPVQNCEKIIYTICRLVIETEGHKIFSRHQIQDEAFGELIEQREQKDNPVDQFSQAWTQNNNETINRWKRVLKRGNVEGKSVYYYSLEKNKYELIEELMEEIGKQE